jgi:hypothetical protein
MFSNFTELPHFIATSQSSDLGRQFQQPPGASSRYPKPTDRNDIYKPQQQSMEM